MGENRKGYVVKLDGTESISKSLVGGKAWSISKMKALGIPVPAAFVISTEACRYFLEHGILPEELDASVRESVTWLENETGREFSASLNPLLVSVRSGSEISMPGMMDTILNLGMNGKVERALAEELEDPVFAKDTHLRFLRLYSEIVLKMADVNSNVESASSLRQEIKAKGGEVPESGYAQLFASIEAVFQSWNSRRAKRYRRHNGISDLLGTAVTIQAMVFGNLDGQSGTGVLFSRNPITGEKKFYGEYLSRSQGEDVVSGKITPNSIDFLESSNPVVFENLTAAAQMLEMENKEVQDIEFTVERGKLFLLQTRAAKRAPLAALRFAVDFVEEGAIDKLTALQRVSVEQLRKVSAPLVESSVLESATAILKGEPACPGVGQGVLVTSADNAEIRSGKGENVVLGCSTTSPEDIHGMISSRALVTELGGSTSHAAVVGRSLGIPTVVKCGEGRVMSLQGMEVTVDGATGTIFKGFLPLSYPEEDSPYLRKLSSWLTEFCPIEVHATSAPVDGRVLDLDNTQWGQDLESLATIIEGYSYAKGSILDSIEGVRMAMKSGIQGILVLHPLSVKLAAVKCLLEDTLETVKGKQDG